MPFQSTEGLCVNFSTAFLQPVVKMFRLARTFERQYAFRFKMDIKRAIFYLQYTKVEDNSSDLYHPINAGLRGFS